MSLWPVEAKSAIGLWCVRPLLGQAAHPNAGEGFLDGEVDVEAWPGSPASRRAEVDEQALSQGAEVGALTLGLSPTPGSYTRVDVACHHLEAEHHFFPKPED